MSGLLVSFDGTDSSGKETQVNGLAKRLRYQGHPVQVFRSPDYALPTGKKIKALFQNKSGAWHALAWRDKMKLFAQNRQEHRVEVLAALKQGDIVLYDRYVSSSLTFITVEALRPQEVELKRATIQQAVADLEYQKHKMPRADASVFLDVPPSISVPLLERRKRVLKDDDEYTDHIEIQERLYNEYDVLCAEQPEHYLRIKCVMGDQLLGIAEITELVWQALIIKFPRLTKKR